MVDTKKVTYEIQNPINAIDKLTSTTLRSIVGDKTLDELLTAREEINARMLQVIDEITDPWGIDITRVEIQSIDQPEQIKEAMEKQMKAERDKSNHSSSRGRKRKTYHRG